MLLGFADSRVGQAEKDVPAQQQQQAPAQRQGPGQQKPADRIEGDT
jgi:hypothetical protein